QPSGVARAGGERRVDSRLRGSHIKRAIAPRWCLDLLLDKRQEIRLVGKGRRDALRLDTAPFREPDEPHANRLAPDGITVRLWKKQAKLLPLTQLVNGLAGDPGKLVRIHHSGTDGRASVRQ